MRLSCIDCDRLVLRQRRLGACLGHSHPREDGIPPPGHDEIRPPPSADLNPIVAAGKPGGVGSVSPSIWKTHQGRPWRWLRMALSASWRRGGSRSRSTTRTRSSQRADHGADLHRWHRPQEASPVWGGLIRWARGALYEGSEDDDRDCQPVRGHHSAGADVGLRVCRGAELGGVFGATRQHRFGPGPRRGTHCYRTAGRPSASLQVTGATAQHARLNRSP